MRKSLLMLFTLFIVMACKNKLKPTEDANDLVTRAKAIHERVITLDTHCDINVANFTDSINYTQNLNTQVTIPKMKSGGLDVAWFIVYTGQGPLTDEGYKNAFENAMAKFEAIHKLVNDIAPNDIELATSSNDVRRISKTGKKVAMIGIENGYPVGLDIKNVEKFYKLGGRYMSLAHNGHSQLSDSNTGEADDVWLHNGLSDLGKEVIKEMNRLGMMIDVSHPSKEAMKQMIALSKAPIIASHSSARALCNHSRNLDDEQLELMKKNGGVVQTVAFQSYLNTEKYNARNESVKLQKQQIADKGTTSSETLPPKVDVSDFVNHIDYLVDKIGIRHVGISSDFDGGGGIEGWSDASETFNVTLELVKRGYTEDEIEMLWSGNLLRVLDEVEAVAKTLN
jgi:membrane dipeptidase